MSQPADFTSGTAEGRYVSEQAQLRDKALRFISEYPDVHGQAWAAARALLHELTGKMLDPDKIWWHRFDTAASSPRAYTGWWHRGTPVESMTLVELMMRRFNAHDQQATDELPVYGGFYTDGPQHGRYDEHNEIALSPAQVLEKFWALDFAAAFRQRVEAFWSAHAQTFCELAKARFLASAGLALRRGELSLDDVQVLASAVTPMDTLAATVQPHVLFRSGAASVRSFDIGGYESAHILRVVDASGWQILYAPGLPKPFHVCRTERDMYDWVHAHLSTAVSRKGFEALFVTAPEATEERAQAVGAVLDEIREHACSADRNLIDPLAARLLNQNERVIEGDVFEHLRDLAQQQTQAVADALASNASLRKQIWIGYLSTFIRFTGPFVVFGWPLALALTGTGIASVGLNVDQALHGRTARLRKAGAVGAILNSIFLLFNLPLLADGAATLRGVAADASALEAPAEEGGAEETIEMQPLSHERVLSGQVPMQGVEVNAAGETWIMLDGAPQAVRFSARLNAWLAIDPANPFAFFENTPVRLNAQGQWERMPAVRLSGGMEQAGPSGLQGTAAGEVASDAPLATIQSSFWDLYMQLNLDEEESLSLLAIDRQKAAINIRDVEPGDELERDTEDDEVLVDAWNNEYRVFRTPEQRYVGGRVRRYTEREEEFNQYLRTGVAKISNQVPMIEELVEDMNLIGLDNRVNLYRGGSGARGTSGATFRNGHIKAGDVLVNTDFTSFTENPYVVRAFASSQAGAASYGFTGPATFDETSIVFELPAGQHLGATPIAPFSVEDKEAESLFTPGHYFEVVGIHEVSGSAYRFVRVQLKEIPPPPAGRGLYEMRTGLPFTREQYAGRLGENGKRLVERFFPLPLDLAGTPAT